MNPGMARRGRRNRAKEQSTDTLAHAHLLPGARDTRLLHVLLAGSSSSGSLLHRCSAALRYPETSTCLVPLDSGRGLNLLLYRDRVEASRSLRLDVPQQQPAAPHTRLTPAARSATNG